MKVITRTNRLTLVGGLLFALLGIAGSHAQAAPTSGSAATEAGPEERRFRRRAKPELPPPPPSPAIEDRTAVPPTPAVPLRQAFPVRTIRVEGSALIPPDEARRLVAPYEGRTLTLADVQRLLQELTQWLRGHGHVTSRASLPPQDVTEGIVVIQILEGRVGRIRVEGARYTKPRVLVGRMATRAGAVLDYATLQRDLARLNANPDRTVKAILLPGETPGTTDVILRAEERSPIHLGLLAHNAGTALTGRHRQGISIGHTNLTGHDDQLVIREEWAERAAFLGTTASYLLPLGASGRTLGLDASHANVLLGRHLRPRDVEGVATLLGATWAEPLWHNDQWELEWATGFEGKRIRSREDGGDRGKDDLRVLRVGPNVLEQDTKGRGILTTELGAGFSRFLGSSRKVDPSASRERTGGQFARVAVGIGRLQRLWGEWQLVVRGAWQWTNDRLPPAEMLRLGGADTVRGYPEGEFLGDYGYSGTVELRTPLPWFRRAGRGPFTFVTFLDGGAGFLRHPLQTEEEKTRLWGVGWGLRWSISPYTAASLDLGFPVGDTSTEKDTPRLYYSVAIGF